MATDANFDLVAELYIKLIVLGPAVMKLRQSSNADCKPRTNAQSQD